MSITETNNVSTAVDAQPAVPTASEPEKEALAKEKQAPNPDRQRYRLPQKLWF